MTLRFVKLLPAPDANRAGGSLWPEQVDEIPRSTTRKRMKITYFTPLQIITFWKPPQAESNLVKKQGLHRRAFTTEGRKWGGL